MTSWPGSDASRKPWAARAVAGLALALAAALAGCGGGGSVRRPDAGRDGPAEASPQADALLAAGRPCGDGTACASGFCSDGVCCATDCSGVCLTCAAAGSVGTCTAAEIGTDPRNDCDDKGPGRSERTDFATGPALGEVLAVSRAGGGLRGRDRLCGQVRGWVLPDHAVRGMRPVPLCHQRRLRQDVHGRRGLAAGASW